MLKLFIFLKRPSFIQIFHSLMYRIFFFIYAVLNLKAANNWIKIGPIISEMLRNLKKTMSCNFLVGNFFVCTIWFINIC